MAIKFYIQKNSLREDSGYFGRAKLDGTANETVIIDRMIEAGCGINRAEIRAVLADMKKAVFALALEGYKVNLEDLVLITPTLSGKFHSQSEAFDPDKHRAFLTAQVSKNLNKSFQSSVKVKKVLFHERKALIVTVEDVKTKTINESLSPNGIVTINGKNLRFDPDSMEEQLCIVDKNESSRSVKVKSFAKITGNQIVCQLPEVIPFQEALIEIRTYLGTKSLRISQTDFVLNVV